MHPYLEARNHEIQENKYPKHHLWGTRAIESIAEWETRFSKTRSLKLPTFLESFLNRSFFRGSPGANVELTALRTSLNANIIYSVCGPLALSDLYPKKLISWVFGLPPNLGNGLKLAHRAYKPKT